VLVTSHHLDEIPIERIAEELISDEEVEPTARKRVLDKAEKKGEHLSPEEVEGRVKQTIPEVKSERARKRLERARERLRAILEGMGWTCEELLAALQGP
jgi:vacuolar-type H+-ATPase subunit E/Vma4